MAEAVEGNDGRAVSKFAHDTLPETVRRFAGMHWGSQLAVVHVKSTPAPQRASSPIALIGGTPRA